MRKFLRYTAALLMLAAMTGCYGPRKAAVNETVLPQQLLLKKELSYIDSLEKISMAKFEEKAIDDTISARVTKKLNEYRNRNTVLLQELEKIQGIMGTRRSYRLSYKSIVIPALPTLEKQVYDSQSLSIRKSTLDMIEALLASAKLNQFSLAAFFGPGLYQLSEQDLPLVEQAFGPLVDSLVVFSNRFSTIPREAILSIYGYADGTPINPESELAQNLQQQSGQAATNAAGLNRILSQLRAEQMSKRISEILSKKSSLLLLPENLIFTEVVQGMGETLPSAKIKDYTIDDERRRIVLFYWSVVPK